MTHPVFCKFLLYGPTVGAGRVRNVEIDGTSRDAKLAYKARPPDLLVNIYTLSVRVRLFYLSIEVVLHRYSELWLERRISYRITHKCKSVEILFAILFRVLHICLFVCVLLCLDVNFLHIRSRLGDPCKLDCGGRGWVSNGVWPIGSSHKISVMLFGRQKSHSCRIRCFESTEPSSFETVFGLALWIQCHNSRSFTPRLEEALMDNV